MAEKYNYSQAELNKLLQGAGQFGVNSFAGPSFIDQWRNGSAQMSALKGLNVGTDISQEQFNTAKSAIGNAKAGAAIGGAVAGLNGLTDIIGQSVNMAQIGDTSQMQGQIDSIGQIGDTQYSSYEQLNSDYDRLAGSQMRLDYNDIRGKSNGELVGGVLSSTLSGASAGLTVGGPWGALAGGVVGLGSGIAGVISGNRKAQDEKKRLEQEAQANMYDANRNLQLANENLMEYDFRSGVSNRADRGGKIKREMSIQAFAERAMRRPRVKEYMPSAGVIRKHCKGGTMVRIKR